MYHLVLDGFSFAHSWELFRSQQLSLLNAIAQVFESNFCIRFLKASYDEINVTDIGHSVEHTFCQRTTRKYARTPSISAAIFQILEIFSDAC